MRLGAHDVSVRWGELLFSTAITAACLAYYVSAYAESTNIQNLLLLTPATAIFVLLYLIVAVRAVSFTRIEGTEPVAADSPGAGLPVMTLAMILLLGLYVGTAGYIGYDIATFAFVAASLAVQGARSVPFILIYSAIFAALVVYGAQAIMPYSIPTLLW